MHKHKFDWVAATICIALSIFWVVIAGQNWHHGHSFIGWMFLVLALYWGGTGFFWLIRK